MILNLPDLSYSPRISRYLRTGVCRYVIKFASVHRQWVLITRVHVKPGRKKARRRRSTGRKYRGSEGKGRRQRNGKSSNRVRSRSFLSRRYVTRRVERKRKKIEEGRQDIRLNDTLYPLCRVHILRVQKTGVKTMP